MMRGVDVGERGSQRLALPPRVAQLSGQRLYLLLRASRRSLRGGAPVLSVHHLFIDVVLLPGFCEIVVDQIGVMKRAERPILDPEKDARMCSRNVTFDPWCVRTARDVLSIPFADLFRRKI